MMSMASLVDLVPTDLLDGRADAVDVSIDRIQLTGGSELRPPARGVTAVVGANNVGKSTLLRQLHQMLYRYPGHDVYDRRSVDEVMLRRVGSAADLLSWLSVHARLVRQGSASGFVRLDHQQPSEPQGLANLWQNLGSDRLSQHLGPFFVSYADVAQRLNSVQGAPQRQDLGDPPVHVLHYLEDDPVLLDEIEGVCQEIFRQPLTLDRLSGLVQLRVGRTGVTAPPVDAVTPEYRRALAALPPLAEQGDGMRSLLGLVLPLVTASHPIVLIDEPEAFLRPPQAAALGRTLARLATQRRLQIILATHDRNLLQGLLDLDEASVSVVRLDRDGNRAHGHQLEAGELRKLWSNPVLRYSNVLDGLFHRRVVLAEADADCRFYAAALDAANEDEPLSVPPSEVLFVPSGGKDALPPLVAALPAIAVPVVVTPDLDVLREQNKLRALVLTVGGDWASMVTDYQQATAPFRQPEQQVRAEHVLSAVTAILNRDPRAPYSDELREEVLAQLRSQKSPWQRVKEHGEQAFRGPAATAFIRLLDALEKLGIVPVRAGELECFAIEVSGKGRLWLTGALAAKAHERPAAREHARRLTESPAVLLQAVDELPGEELSHGEGEAGEQG